MNSSPSRWIQNYVQLVFCLFTKDLDTMDYSPLLFQKLSKYGIIGTANLWLSSYLKEKSQYVCYSSEKSDQINICCGVPQGSISEPNLSILYINYMVNVSNFFNL